MQSNKLDTKRKTHAECTKGYTGHQQFPIANLSDQQRNLYLFKTGPSFCYCIPLESQPFYGNKYDALNREAKSRGPEVGA